MICALIILLAISLQNQTILIMLIPINKRKRYEMVKITWGTIAVVAMLVLLIMLMRPDFVVYPSVSTL